MQPSYLSPPLLFDSCFFFFLYSQENVWNSYTPIINTPVSQNIKTNDRWSNIDYDITKAPVTGFDIRQHVKWQFI